MPVRSYRDLIVWQRSMELVEETYSLCSRLPAADKQLLADQMRRSAVSVAANIAEGHSRVHRKEFLHLLSIARGSLMELETHLLIAERVDLLSIDQISRALALTDEVSRMLRAMRAKLSST
jgi:four helix bundle protein